MSQLAGKVAIVTGGASGLGRASVQRFCAEGANVVIADVDAERGEALATELGSSVRYVHTDVSDEGQVQALLDYTVGEFAGLDIMFNNAGISQAMHSHFVDDDLKGFRKVLDINLMGVIYGSQRAARYMKDNGGGVILNTASISGNLAGYGLIAYRTSKAALIHFTKCIAIDFAEYGIRVNCISPGNIQTEMSSFPVPGMTSEQVQKMKQAMLPIRQAGQPLKRQGTTEDFANAALFLVSDQSAQITGHELVLDGGATAGDPINHFEKVRQAQAKIMAEIS